VIVAFILPAGGVGQEVAAAHWPRSLASTNGDRPSGGPGIPNFGELTWEEAMRQGYAALLGSEHLYDDINDLEGARTSTSRSTFDDQRSTPPKPKPGSRWPASLEAKANGMAI
jgi:hypothetical protein